MITARDLSIAFALTALAVLATTLLLMALGPDWAAYAPATCTATRCFCELPRIGSLVLQPADSYSSYGYAFVGLLIIVLARGDHWRSGFGRDGHQLGSGFRDQGRPGDDPAQSFASESREFARRCMFDTVHTRLISRCA